MKLLKGDSLQILKTLPSRSVDLVLTDPPYGDNSGYGRGNRKIAGNANPLTGLMALAECHRILKSNTTCYFFLDVKHLSFVRTFVEQYTAFNIKDWLVWDKVHIGMGRGFRKRHELIAVLEKGKPTYNDNALPNVLACQRVSTSEHPHKKPTDLLRRLICHSSQPGDTVLDPFMGIGSSGVAATSESRSFIGIEIDEQHFHLAQQYVNVARRFVIRVD